MFDLLSSALFAAIVGLFILRRRHEEQRLAPYLTVCLVSVVGGFLGNHGGGLAAVALLIAGAFLTLHLASEPYGDNAEERP